MRDDALPLSYTSIETMANQHGVETETYGLTVQRSARLSY